jgi:hypothetical protein
LPGNGWKVREQEEVDSLFDMGVFEWVPVSEVPNGTKLVRTKMVYKDKCDMPGVPGRRKVRCVGKGYMESANEYGCVWAPVTRHETCRTFSYGRGSPHF